MLTTERYGIRHRLPQGPPPTAVCRARDAHRSDRWHRWPTLAPVKQRRWHNPQSARCACQGTRGSPARSFASMCGSASAYRDTPSNNSARQTRSATSRRRRPGATDLSASLNFSSSDSSFIRLRCGAMSSPSRFIWSISFWPGDTIKAMSVSGSHPGAHGVPGCGPGRTSPHRS